MLLDEIREMRVRVKWDLPEEFVIIFIPFYSVQFLVAHIEVTI